MPKVTINNEQVDVAEFKAFKGLVVGEQLSRAEHIVAEIADAIAARRSELATKNALVLERPEARRQFGPRPLFVTRQNEAGDVVQTPAVNDAGEPLTGPDELASITEQDWEAAGNRLRIPNPPSDGELMAAAIPIAFRVGRAEILRLMALALATNADLEKLDNDGTVANEEAFAEWLDERARELSHRATLGELVELAGDLLVIVLDQVRDPFGELRAKVSAVMDVLAPTTPDQGEMAPVEIEHDPATSPASPTSSTFSGADTTGAPTSSSTGFPGAELPG